MFTRDIHANKETVEQALYDLESSIKIARKEKDKLLCLVVGYGSSGGTHKIKTAVINQLDEMKKNHQIKDYILGSDCDLFSKTYLNFNFKERVPEEIKKRHNPGEILIIL